MYIQENGSVFASYRSAISNLSKSNKALSSGKKNYSSGVSPSSIGIANRAEHNIRTSQALIPSFHDAQGMGQVQEQILKEVNDMVTRIGELAAMATDVAKMPSDLITLHNEFSQLVNAIGNLAGQTTYNGIPVFSAASAVDLYISADANGLAAPLNVGQINLQAISTALATYSLSTLPNAQNTLTGIFSSQATGIGLAINTLLIQVGSNLTTLEQEYSIKQLQLDQHEVKKSELEDVDIMQEVANNTKINLQLNSAMSVLNQNKRYKDNISNFIMRMLN